MGIFSFGKKDDDAPPRRGSRTGSSRSVRSERVERRPRRTERPDTDALLLDPTLPEKQRARRRLVGAIALVIAAVIVLPMVLDSHPKPVTDDIAIDIPNRPAHPAAARDDDAADVQAGVARDEPPASDATAADMAPAAPAAAKNPKDTRTAAVAPAKPAPSAPVANAAPKPAPSTSQAPSAVATAADSGDASSPASPPGARFAVQLGAFQDDATARAWATKLKAAGVPAYVEHRKQADGSAAALLRAGPFADRAAASAAIAKVRDAGLTQ
ncbi:SPOR domain-containing protein [Burkholderia alba]|uniref:SPOR domain-containing protein n=1 Tax=Burkholderia alba TaxID=2683677 RepID=UPI002B061520|nr:SPOR domain-containing protein [Burkholderia alba]